jgi:hypothetical protein
MSEHHNRHAGQGAVMLDIGGDVGALVVIAPVELAGTEIEAREVGTPAVVHAPHAAVLGRPTPNGIVHSLVIGALNQGEYELRRLPDGPVAMRAIVAGGEVTQIRWPIG